MPSVLFIYKNKNLAKQFTKHFKLNGYDVTEFYEEPIPYSPKGMQKWENILYRVVFKNPNHIHNIYERNFVSHSNRIIKKLKSKSPHFDYCFIIRGDLVPPPVLKYARAVSGKMIDYQLDGLAVSSKILDYKGLFDQIYVFDEQDVIDYPGYDLKATTNCYFEEKIEDGDIWDIYYTGALVENRLRAIENLCSFLGSQYRYHINLGSGRDFDTAAPIHFLKEQLSYGQNLEYTRQSRVLLDFKRKEHDGFSLRFFEAMGFEKKIITDNVAVKHYDFYDPQNIFITDYKNFDGLADFLQTPYKTLDEAVKKKYGFKTWISELLEGN